MHAPDTTGFKTNDPEEAHALLTSSYAGGHGTRMSGSVEDFRFEYSRRELGDCRFDALRNTLDSAYVMGPVGYLVIARVLGGSVEVCTEGTQRRMQRGDIFLTTHPHSDYSTRQYDVEMQVVGVELPLIGQLVDEPVTGVVDRLRTESLPPQLAHGWLRTVNYLTTAVLNDDAYWASPLMLGQTGRLLAAALIAAFDPTGSYEQPHDRTDATPEAVRRAIAYIDTNPDLNISVADIARASCVGVRALQLAFRRHLNTTPMAYLRKVRLDRVHTELLAADPSEGATVARIAADWGFHNSSRFAEWHRNTYDELPSHTLRHRG